AVPDGQDARSGERLLDRAQHTQVRARAPDDVTPGRTTRPGRGVVRAASLRSAVARRDAVVRGVVVRGGVADPDACGERLRARPVARGERGPDLGARDARVDGEGAPGREERESVVE